MINALFRYFLILALLLLGGYSQDYAHSFKDAGNSLSGSQTNRTLVNSTFQEKGEGDKFFYAPLDSERKKQTDLAEVAEVKAEEDEVHFSKKYIPTNNYSSVSFDAQSAVYIFHFLKHRASQRKQLAYHSSPTSRIVTFGVFRI